MRRGDHRDWYPTTPKKAPPKRGIKVKKSGSTWWGQRWVEALERLSSGYSNRLARGRTYARAGRTHDLIVKAGEVTAKVTGSRTTPYQVRIAVAKLPDAVWVKAIRAMASQAQFAAELLAGRMPPEIDAAFEEAGASVFPVKESDLRTDCSCPDWANPCKHVAATHYVLGEALDRDPFLLLELRGRTREQVLDALRAARTGTKDGGPSERKGSRRKETPSEDVSTVSLGRIKVADYDKLRDPLPTLHLTFEPPPVWSALLGQLGAPAGWGQDVSPVEMLGPLIRAAARRARTLAMTDSEVEGGSEASLADTSGVSRLRSRTRRSRVTAPAAAGATKAESKKLKSPKLARKNTSKGAATRTAARPTVRRKKA